MQNISELQFCTFRKIMGTLISHDICTYITQYFEDAVCSEMEKENTIENGGLS